ncbi:MAG: CoA-acylating methylmalonate-semialdehyde dehydrogenase [Spirochaetia bacterium]
MSELKQLKNLIKGQWLPSETDQYFRVQNPSLGVDIADFPASTEKEIDAAVKAAAEAFPKWSAMPVMKRVRILYKFRDLIDAHFEELVNILAREQGKVLEEAAGDVLKAKEIVEFACGAPSLMMGESIMNTSNDFDTVLYREPIGVFAGLPPFNFPAMIPMGWMVPLCIATGNTMVLKASPVTPMTALRMAELLMEAGLPAGVLNVITCSNSMAERLVAHPAVKGVSFVGSTETGQKVYAAATAHGKRVQALCSAKNHALVLEDADLERTADAVVRSSFGCAGQRCMALPVVVVQESVADRFVQLLKEKSAALRVGIAYENDSDMGPVISRHRRDELEKWIEIGLEEGAELVLDGRGVKVAGAEGGFFIGPTIFDRVGAEMKIGNQELFGPILCVKRVKSFADGLRHMNGSPYANGATIFTGSGYYAREFSRLTDAGMVGINVGIPVPIGVFPFSGHKKSFFGDLHTLGKDGVRFFTETKCVTSRWFDPDERGELNEGTWGGTI